MKNLKVLFVCLFLCSVFVFAGEPSNLSTDEKLLKIAEMEYSRRTGPELYALLQDNSAGYAVMARAARAFGRIADPTSVVALRKRFPATDGPESEGLDKARKEFIFAAGQLTVNCPVESLAPYLENGSGFEGLSCEAMGKAGIKAAPWLDGIVALKKHADASVREKVPVALMRIKMDADKAGKNASAVVGAAEEALSLAWDSDAGVRSRLAYAMRYLPRLEGGGAALLAMMKGAEEEKHNAVLAASKYVGEALREKLLELSKDPDWRVRSASATSLSKYSHVKAVAGLVAMLRDENFHVRRTAAIAAGQAEIGDAAGGLRELLIDDSAIVRAEAAVALARIEGDESFRYTQSLLQDKSAVARAGLARAAGAVASDNAGEVMEKLWAASEDTHVKAAIMGALQDSMKSSPTAYKLARVALDVDDVPTRYYALQILGETGKDWAFSRIRLFYEKLKKKPGKKNDVLRYTAVSFVKERVLARPLEKDLEFLEGALDDPAYEVRSLAAETLQLVDGKKREIEPEEDKNTFPVPGKDFILKDAARIVEVKTNRGAFSIELFPDEAPVHVYRFLQLVQKKFYDGKTWHRVVSDFVVQGGCPQGTGWGGADFKVPLEISRRPFLRGTVGMARSSERDSGSCQFFICHSLQPRLDGLYTVFGRVVEGMDRVDSIQPGDVMITIRLKDGE